LCALKIVAAIGQLQLDVVNSGDAIPADRLGSLFEPFVSYREGGLGLGLWATYQLVTRMGGRIDVVCEDQTVHFTVAIPIDRGETSTE